MTPEGKVKKKVKALLDKYGAYYITPIASGYGRAGIPDYIALLGAAFIAIEVKATSADTPRLNQLKNLIDIDERGGIPLVIHEGNIETLESTLKAIQGDSSARLHTDIGTIRTQYRACLEKLGGI